MKKSHAIIASATAVIGTLVAVKTSGYMVATERFVESEVSGIHLILLEDNLADANALIIKNENILENDPENQVAIAALASALAKKSKIEGNMTFHRARQ